MNLHVGVGVSDPTAAAVRSGLGIRGPKDNEHLDQVFFWEGGVRHGWCLNCLFVGEPVRVLVLHKLLVPGFRLFRDISSGVCGLASDFKG